MRSPPSTTFDNISRRVSIGRLTLVDCPTLKQRVRDLLALQMCIEKLMNYNRPTRYGVLTPNKKPAHRSRDTFAGVHRASRPPDIRGNEKRPRQAGVSEAVIGELGFQLGLIFTVIRRSNLTPLLTWILRTIRLRITLPSRPHSHPNFVGDICLHPWIY